MSQKNKVKKYAMVKVHNQNPRLNIRETRIVGQGGIKFQATAEIVLRIDRVQYDDEGNIRLPEEWSPEKISEAIINVLSGHGVAVFQGFERLPIVKMNLRKRGYNI